MATIRESSSMGIAPTNFKKEIGSHEIILRQEGYRTKSYTVEIENEEGDVTFSFSPLIRQEE